MFNESDLGFIATQCSVQPLQARNVMALLAEGMTVPFISRYRKEKTGNLDEFKVQQVSESYEYLKELNDRKETVLKTISQQGKLTAELKEKIEQTQASRVQLEVFDVAGNVTVCDPVTTLVVRETGKPVSETLTNIPYEESYVTVYNGDPGLKKLDIIVNGTQCKITALGHGRETTIDVLSAMLPGDNNTITLVARGKPGCSANVIISD